MLARGTFDRSTGCSGAGAGAGAFRLADDDFGVFWRWLASLVDAKRAHAAFVGGGSVPVSAAGAAGLEVSSLIVDNGGLPVDDPTVDV